MNAISNKSNGIKCGHDGFAMDILKQLTFTKRGKDFLMDSQTYITSLTKVLDHIYHDTRIPTHHVVNFFAGGNLIALQKNNTTQGPPGGKIRPIRMGASYPKIIEEDAHHLFSLEVLAPGRVFCGQVDC